MSWVMVLPCAAVVMGLISCVFATRSMILAHGVQVQALKTLRDNWPRHTITVTVPIEGIDPRLLK